MVLWTNTIRGYWRSTNAEQANRQTTSPTDSGRLQDLRYRYCTSQWIEQELWTLERLLSSTISEVMKSICRNPTQWLQRLSGDNGGFNVRGLTLSTSAVVTSQVTPTSQPSYATTKLSSDRFGDGHSKGSSVGYTPVFHAHTAQVAVRFRNYLRRLTISIGSKPVFPKDRWRMSNPLPTN